MNRLTDGIAVAEARYKETFDKVGFTALLCVVLCSCRCVVHSDELCDVEVC